MRAIVAPTYDSPDVLRLRDVQRPVPDDDQVLVSVRAASVNPADWHLLTGTPYVVRLVSGLRRPEVPVPGIDAAGVVEAVGESVTKLRPGDRVFGAGKGAFAEYMCAPEDSLVEKPAHLTFEQAAAVPVAAVTALQALRDEGEVVPGQTVLINGASGGVGTFAVQIAKALGLEVTGVCSTRNVDLVRSIGAGHVVDYTREDFTRSGQRYDVMLDMVGNRSLSACRRVLESEGTYVIVGGPKGRWLGGLAPVLRGLLVSPFVSQRVRWFIADVNRRDLLFLKELLDVGEVTPVIDRTYGLADAAEALRHLETGHARGKIVIIV